MTKIAKATYLGKLGDRPADFLPESLAWLCASIFGGVVRPCWGIVGVGVDFGVSIVLLLFFSSLCVGDEIRSFVVFVGLDGEKA